jgi:hypothetical protein
MPIRIGFLSLVVALAACRGHREVHTPDPTSRRTIPSGDVVGFTGEYGSHVWMGLPYAAPPTGDRRWREPVPPAVDRRARSTRAGTDLARMLGASHGFEIPFLFGHFDLRPRREPAVHARERGRTHRALGRHDVVLGDVRGDRPARRRPSPRLPSARDRRLAYHDLVVWSGTLSRAGYDAKCPDNPFDDYPWRS